MLAGDIESNPGPLTEDQQQLVLQSLAILPQLQAGQTALFNELKTIQSNQNSVDAKLATLATRLTSVEANLESVPQLRNDVNCLLTSTAELASQVKSLASQCENLEGQSRRSNLIFYGIPDSSEETWTASEAKVISLCQETLGIKFDASFLERSHRLGAFRPNRNRPIIAKFTSFKLKQDVLFSASKLKGTAYSLSEDFSLKTRNERKKLLEFARTQNAKFQLRYNRLYMGDRMFYVDPITLSVKSNDT